METNLSIQLATLGKLSTKVFLLCFFSSSVLRGDFLAASVNHTPMAQRKTEVITAI